MYTLTITKRGIVSRVFGPFPTQQDAGKYALQLEDAAGEFFAWAIASLLPPTTPTPTLTTGG